MPRGSREWSIERILSVRNWPAVQFRKGPRARVPPTVQRRGFEHHGLARCRGKGSPAPRKGISIVTAKGVRATGKCPWPQEAISGIRERVVTQWRNFGSRRVVRGLEKGFRAPENCRQSTESVSNIGPRGWFLAQGVDFEQQTVIRGAEKGFHASGSSQVCGPEKKFRVSESGSCPWSERILITGE